MATYTNAKEYNTYLVNNDIDINIINYVKEINMEGGASTPPPFGGQRSCPP